jgi:hypothetical protein
MKSLFLCQDKIKIEHKKKKIVLRFTNSTININTEKYAYWKNFIVPSCILENGYSQCVFCHRTLKSAFAMRRHYNEQHHDNIPEGIFGSKTEYECVECDLKFTRKFQLKHHLTSDFHLNKRLQGSNEKLDKAKRLPKNSSFSNVIESTEKIKKMTENNKLTDDEISSEQPCFQMKNNETTKDLIEKLALKKNVENELTNNPLLNTNLSSKFENCADLDEYQDFTICSKGFIQYKTSDDINASKLDRALSNYLLHNLSFN